MMRHFIIANFGNDSIALIEWARQHALSDLVVISVDTGWAAPGWQQHIELVDHYLRRHQIEHVRVRSEYAFPWLVQERQNFPSIKFHWCASFLKGLPILNYLDSVDQDLTATVLLAKRRQQAAALQNLQEFEQESHAYGSRKVWYPLYQHMLEQRNQLISQAGFDLLQTRSLECDPCIYNQARDFKRLDPARRQQLATLETSVGRPMFSVPIERVVAESFSDADLAGNDKSVYYQGCGSEFACGD